MNTKGENIFVSFLELLKVKHTKSFSNQYFGEHPHKYNLFGISKMLSDYSIENGGTKVADKEKDIFEIETPFIAHTGSDFATVYKVEPDKVHYNIGYLLVLKQLHIHSEYADKICSLL
ncbi:hypothetical protein FACS189420_0120 [Bacteroidia bacterium]|nr:hypothetical protein FACS18947_0040 [Bacteroidia bacterium]GHV70165.1 hypothetical protein FACS189420_0120 [Bacteroidia bacterium]